jgi:hypothetical protein
VQLDGRTALYTRTGDWFAGVCLVACIILAIASRVESRGSSAGRAESGERRAESQRSIEKTVLFAHSRKVECRKSGEQRVESGELEQPRT